MATFLEENVMRKQTAPSSTTAPVRVGEVVQVVAQRLNDDGEGVTSVQGFTVFVPHLLPGESGQARINFVKKSFARAQLMERTADADMRRQPDCAVFGACGGCQLQHLDYEEQLQHKTQRVAWALRSLPQDVPPTIHPILGMDTPIRYRNQVQIPVRWTAEGRVEIGFFSVSSHQLVATDTCHLESLAMEQTARALADWLQACGPEVAGHVHHLILRESFTTKQQMVIFAMTRSKRSFVERMKTLLDAIGGPRLGALVSVGFTVQPLLEGPVWGADTHIVAGQSHLTETLLGVEYLISPRSFFQVNTRQAARMYETVRDMAALTAEDHVLDAYSGTGSISLLLAKCGVASVVGIESIQAAIDDAWANSQHNHVDNVTFQVGEVETVLPKLVKQGAHFDVAVLDPPRKGIHPDALQAVLDARPKRIVYISCNPATLGRDLGPMVAAGYRVTEVQPVDMFPQTSHVECLILMTRK
jgi:23S rRNA (uracil1939-C5)-methyltransferase